MCLLIRIIASFILYTDDLNCTNDPKIVNEYDQEIPQLQTADNPEASR